MPEPGQDLRKWRLKEGLTQEQAATALGVTLRTYQHWERGEGGPSVTNAVAIERAGGPPVDAWT